MKEPRDWNLTVTDHAGGRLLVEVREDGRLRHREWHHVDEVLTDGALAEVLAWHHPDGWARQARGGAA